MGKFSPSIFIPRKNTAKQTILLDISPWPADETNGGCRPNLNPKFVAEMEQKLGLTFQPDLTDLEDLSGREFGPEEIFHYNLRHFPQPDLS